MTLYIGYLYLLFGIIFLLIPLIYIELGRPRDFIKGGLNLVIGMLLILKHNSFDTLYSSIFIVITTLLTFYKVEIFSIRWNQLTDQEKNKLKTLEELKKNLSIFLMIRRPPRSTQGVSSAASDVYKRQVLGTRIFGCGSSSLPDRISRGN